MVVTLALVVFCMSIVVFFSQEFIRLFKKIAAIPGVKLLLPLIIASGLIAVYEHRGHKLLLWCQTALHQMIHKLSTLMPFTTGAIFLTRIIFLFIISSLPIWFVYLQAKHRKRPNLGTFAFQLGLALWIVAAVLLSVAII